MEVPKIKTDLGREMHFVKLPNFLSIESRPFDPETYEDELDEDLQQQVILLFLGWSVLDAMKSTESYHYCSQHSSKYM